MRCRAVMMVLIAASAIPAWAVDLDLPRGKWWEEARVIEKINLSAEQQEKIRALVYQHAHHMIDLNAEVKRTELDLADRVDRDDFKVDDIRAAFARFQTARQRLEAERFEMLLSIRQVLAADQWDALLEIRRAFKRQQRHAGPNRGPDRPRRPPGEGRPPMAPRR